MQASALRSVAVVALVVLAGCSGALNAADQSSVTPAPGTDGDATATQGYSVTVVSQTGGSAGDGVNVYVSDEANAIGDFAHLNVTITSVGFQRADGGGWVERDVDDRSVDLTRLRGANATRLATVDAPNGSYDTVFAHVGDVNATLTDGESVRVKLPSEKLHVEKSFTVGDGESVDFVFDVAVHEAGKSGKYVLRPVVTESGTDVPMESVDEDDAPAAALNVSFVGTVTRGGNATIDVRRNGTAVANATVTVADERVGATGADGRATVALPDADEVTVEVTAGEAETELELEFERADEPAEANESAPGSPDDRETDEPVETTEPTASPEPSENATASTDD